MVLGGYLFVATEQGPYNPCGTSHPFHFRRWLIYICHGGISHRILEKLV